MKVRNLYKSFGEKRVLKGLSFDAGIGITGISAPSGGGKTTLFRIIAGLEKPDSGDITEVGKISYAFQQPRLLPWKTALENAKIAEKSPGTAKEILTELGLGNDLQLTPSALSGGMQKRVALARALAADFDTLLLDEPFAGLDKNTESEALEVIRAHAKGKCVLIVSHEPDVLKKLDKVIEI